MALKRNEHYPGRFSNPTTAHPQGAFKNRTAPNSQDGSYLEQDWANDWDGFFSSLLSAAGVTPNGNVDAVGASQYFDALSAIMTGRLIGPPKIFTVTGTYTPTAGTKKIIVEVQGAGGGGGGAAISSTGASAGGGGTSGCYAKALITSLDASYAVQIGTGGAGGISNSQGSGGGRTSFGSVVSADGGYGGDNMNTGSTPFICHASSGTQPVTPVAVGGNIMMINIQQQPTRAFRLSGAIASSGPGGASIFGNGGGNAVTTGSATNNGGNGVAYGSGGGGGLCVGTTASSTNGGRGADGVVIVWEYA